MCFDIAVLRREIIFLFDFPVDSLVPAQEGQRTISASADLLHLQVSSKIQNAYCGGLESPPFIVALHGLLRGA